MLTKEQRKKLLFAARQSIEANLSGNKTYKIKETDPELLKKNGAFVTLTENGALRGCIGLIQGNAPLIDAVCRMAVEAATNDPRFPALTLNELANINIEISVLSPLEKIKDINKIEVGKHGIYICKDYYSGLLLPQVAAEYGWDRETFLKQTCYKAGLPEDTYKSQSADIFIFSAEVFNESNV